MKTYSPLITAALTVCASLTSAQGTLPANEGFHFVLGSVEAPGGACTGVVELGTQDGTIDLSATGAFVVGGRERQACPDGSVQVNVGANTGTYTLAGNGRLFYDGLPAMPGTEVFELRYRFDHGILNFWDDNLTDPSANFAIAARRSSSAPTLIGTYYVVRQRSVAVAGAFQNAVESGVLVFDGAGGWTESGLRHVVTVAGTSNSSYSQSGTVTVAADGALTFPGQGAGGTSPDGELCFWALDEPAGAGLAIAVRAGGGLGAANLAGAFEVGSLELRPTPRGSHSSTRLSIDNSGVVSGGGVTVTRTAAGAFRGSVTHGGSASVNPLGVLTWNDSTLGTPLVGALSSSGRYLIAASISEPGRAELRFGFRACVAPLAYGTGTAGLAGVPSLTSTGGLPFVGNAAFGYALSSLRSGAGGLVLTASAPLPGVPLLGGRVWINPTTLFSTAGLTADAAGNANVSAPLPGSVGLVGTDLHAQAFVFDGAAPAGVAMSAGLAFELCD